MRYNINTGRPVSEDLRTQDAKSYIGSNQNSAKQAFTAKTRYAQLTTGVSAESYEFELDLDLVPGRTTPKAYEEAGLVEVPAVTVSSLFSPTGYEDENYFRIINNTRMPMLGTINRSLIPLQPKRQFFSYYEDNKRSHFALDFVINSFINFKTAYARGIFEGKGISNSEFLSSLSLYKAGVDLSTPITLHLQGLIDDFVGFCINDFKNRRKVITPENFFNYFSNYLIFISKIRPVTFSTKALTQEVDFNFNGISLDIADIAYDVDAEKAKRMYFDPNMQLFINGAKEFGFVISQEYPFKLIANLGSSKMKDSMCACGKTYLNGQVFNTVDEILSFYFEPVYMNDLSIMYNLYDMAYERFIQRFKVEYVTDYGQNSLQRYKFYRETNEFELIEPFVTDENLLTLYIAIKNNEIGLGFRETVLRSFMLTAKQIYNNFDLATALRYVNEKFRITYELFMLEKKGFKNIESFTYEEALALIRLTRYDY